ncbi:hypothetical protein EMCRGX_G030831 [Ephydatia muelleri]
MPPKKRKRERQRERKGKGKGERCKLEELMEKLKDDIKREQTERGYFQLERDKVNAFWDITKKQLEEAKATIRNKERELEETEERHQVEIKVYKQKVKHLLYEHQNNITELKRDGSTKFYANTMLSPAP